MQVRTVCNNVLEQCVPRWVHFLSSKRSSLLCAACLVCDLFCSLCLPLSFSFFYKPPSGEQPNLRDVNINTIEQNSRNKQPNTNASETKQRRFPFFALLLLPANGRTHCSAIHSRLPSRTPHRRSATTRCPPTLNRGGLN